MPRRWSQPDSNRRPPACKAGALPTELWPRFALDGTGEAKRAEGQGHRGAGGEAAGGPSVPQESEAGEQSGEGHGKPDKPAKQTEERPEPSRAEVSNYFEWVQNLQHFRWSEDEVNEKLGGIMRRAYRQVAERAREDGTPMRPAAYELGIERVVEAASTRGYI